MLNKCLLMKRPYVHLYKFYLSFKSQLTSYTFNGNFFDHFKLKNYCLYSFKLKNHHLTCPNYLFNLKFPARLQAEGLQTSRATAHHHGINMQIRKRYSSPLAPFWVSAQLRKVDSTFVHRKRNFTLQTEAALCQDAQF